MLTNAPDNKNTRLMKTNFWLLLILDSIQLLKWLLKFDKSLKLWKLIPSRFLQRSTFWATWGERPTNRPYATAVREPSLLSKTSLVVRLLFVYESTMFCTKNLRSKCWQEKFNLQHISDAPSDRPDPRAAREKERQKAFKKRCKKLKLRMVQRFHKFLN